jgi:hypothetical protein
LGTTYINLSYHCKWIRTYPSSLLLVFLSHPFSILFALFLVHPDCTLDSIAARLCPQRFSTATIHTGPAGFVVGSLMGNPHESWSWNKCTSNIIIYIYYNYIIKLIITVRYKIFETLDLNVFVVVMVAITT